LQACLHPLARQLQASLAHQSYCLEFEPLGLRALLVREPQPQHRLKRCQMTQDANYQNMTTPSCKQKTQQPNQTLHAT
jgi:hypothetical protein